MADTQGPDLPALTSLASGDVFYVVDASDTATDSNPDGSSKHITAANLAAGIASIGGLATDAEVAAAVASLSSVYQPLDSDLTAIAALSTTTFGRSLLALADAAAARTALGLAIGTDVAAQSSLAGYQPLDSDLTAIAALTTTSFGRSLLALADAAAGRAALGLVIGTDVQAQDAELAAIAGLTSAADRLPYFTGSGTASLATFTAAGRALVDDADADAQLATLAAVDRENGGLETVSSPTISTNTLTLNLANGNVFTVAHNANITTLTLSGATSGRMCSLSLRLTQDATGGRTITWPAAVKWPSATAPTLTTTANAVNWVELWTVDGGTTWFGALSGAGFA